MKTDVPLTEDQLKIYDTAREEWEQENGRPMTGLEPLLMYIRLGFVREPALVLKVVSHDEH